MIEIKFEVDFTRFVHSVVLVAFSCSYFHSELFFLGPGRSQYNLIQLYLFPSALFLLSSFVLSNHLVSVHNRMLLEGNRRLVGHHCPLVRFSGEMDQTAQNCRIVDYCHRNYSLFHQPALKFHLLYLTKKTHQLPSTGQNCTFNN